MRTDFIMFCLQLVEMSFHRKDHIKSCMTERRSVLGQCADTGTLILILMFNNNIL